MNIIRLVNFRSTTLYFFIHIIIRKIPTCGHSKITLTTGMRNFDPNYDWCSHVSRNRVCWFNQGKSLINVVYEVTALIQFNYYDDSNISQDRIAVYMYQLGIIYSIATRNELNVDYPYSLCENKCFISKN